MVGAFREPSCGRSVKPIHSILYSVAQPLERGFKNYYSIIQGTLPRHFEKQSPRIYPVHLRQSVHAGAVRVLRGRLMRPKWRFCANWGRAGVPLCTFCSVWLHFFVLWGFVQRLPSGGGPGGTPFFPPKEGGSPRKNPVPPPFREAFPFPIRSIC